MKERDETGSTEVARSKSTPNTSKTERALFEEKLRFLKAEDFYSFPCTEATESVLATMRKTRAGGVLLTLEDARNPLAGIFTERDYLDKLAGEPAKTAQPIKNFMTVAPRCLSPEDTVGDAIRLMTEGGYRHIPLLVESQQGAEKSTRIYGMVSVRHIMVFISEHFAEDIFNLPPVLDQRISTPEGG